MHGRRMVGRGYVRPGYDLGWATSAGLLTWLGPSAVLSTGGMSSVAFLSC